MSSGNHARRSACVSGEFRQVSCCYVGVVSGVSGVVLLCRDCIRCIRCIRCRVVMSGLYQVYQVSCCYVGIVSGVSGVVLLCWSCIRWWQNKFLHRLNPFYCTATSILSHCSYWCLLTLSLLSSTSVFSQPFKKRCMSDVARICSIITFHLSKLWKVKFSILCDVIFLVRLQGNFGIDHSQEWKG